MKNRLIIILIIVGALLAYAGFGDTVMLMKGNTININTAELDEYSEKALAEGDITFVYGPFATLESTTTNYGVKHTTETEFYLVSGEDVPDGYIPGSLVIFSTSDDEMISKLNDADAAWWDYLTSEEEDVSVPDVKIPFKGKTFDRPTEAEFDEYLNEELDYLGYDSSEVAELRITGTEVGAASIALFIGGIVLFLLGIGLFVAGIVARKKVNSSYDGEVIADEQL